MQDEGDGSIRVVLVVGSPPWLRCTEVSPYLTPSLSLPPCSVMKMASALRWMPRASTSVVAGFRHPWSCCLAVELLNDVSSLMLKLN